MPVKRAAAACIRSRSSGSFTHQTYGLRERGATAADLIEVAARHGAVSRVKACGAGSIRSRWMSAGSSSLMPAERLRREAARESPGARPAGARARRHRCGRSPGTRTVLPGHRADGPLDLALDGARVLLLLPAAVVRAGVFDRDLVTGHARDHTRRLPSLDCRTSDTLTRIGRMHTTRSRRQPPEARRALLAGHGLRAPRLRVGAGRDRSRRPASSPAPDVETQTEQCLRNLRAILQAGGSDLQHVLRCGVFLLDMEEFQQMNGVYARMFGEHRPARTTIQAAGLPGRGTARRDRLHRLRAEVRTQRRAVGSSARRSRRLAR